MKQFMEENAQLVLFHSLQPFLSVNRQILPEFLDLYNPLRNKIIENNIRYVYRIATIYRRNAATKTLSVDEIASAGTLGLIKAIRKFDPFKGIKFLTYATFWIRNAIQEEFHRQSTIAVPHRIKKLGRKIQEFMTTNHSSLEVSLRELKIPKKDHDRIACYILRPVISTSGGEEENDLAGGDVNLDILRKEEVEVFHENLKQLPTNQRITIQERLGGKTLEEIGVLLDRTKERIRQYEVAAKKTLRNYYANAC